MLATLFVPELVAGLRGRRRRTSRSTKELIDLALKMERGGRGRRQGGRRRTSPRRKAILGKLPGRGRPLGLAGQAAHARGRQGASSPPRSSSSRPTSSSRAPPIATRRRRRSRRRRRTCSRKQAEAAKAKVDVAVARARLAVAESEEKRLEALVGYLTLTAPYDGVIVARNANTGDFVLPATGDPSATATLARPVARRAPRRSTWSTAPTCVRIFVDVPEQDADFVQIGTKATRARPGVPRHGAPGAASRGPPGPSTSRAARSAPRSTCPTPTARSCPGCTPTAR